MKQNQDRSDVIHKLQAMDPLDFEHFVADLWEQEGWETEVTKASDDCGVDVRAVKNESLVRQTAAIQVKCYADENKVGRDEVQQYLAIRTQDSDVDAAIIVTTSSFTRPAEDWAGEHGVRLFDGNDLRKKLKGKYAGTVSDPSRQESRDESKTVAEKLGKEFQEGRGEGQELSQELTENSEAVTERWGKWKYSGFPAGVLLGISAGLDLPGIFASTLFCGIVWVGALFRLEEESNS